MAVSWHLASSIPSGAEHTLNLASFVNSSPCVFISDLLYQTGNHVRLMKSKENWNQRGCTLASGMPMYAAYVVIVYAGESQEEVTQVSLFWSRPGGSDPGR